MKDPHLEKSSLITMKIPADKMKLILRPSIQILQNIFTKNNHEIRVVGGAVRDLLMNRIPADVDFATTATPSEMKNMFTSEGISITNRNGEKHGTITACIGEDNLECSTLHIIKIDGTCKEIEFVHDWEHDANSRDLTVNAMFLALDGTVYDYVNGIQHLKEKNVRFVGNPDLTIQANHHRILRYFRFFGMLTNDPHNHNTEAIAAIIRNRNGLSEVSPEVMKKELKKILIGKYNFEILLKIIECELGDHIGLSGEFDCENLSKIYKNIKDTDYHYCLLLVAGMKDEEELTQFFNRAQFSKHEIEMLHFVIKHRNLFYNLKSLKDIRNILVDFVYEEEIENDTKKIDKYKKKKSTKRSLALEVSKQLLLYVGRNELIEEVSESLIPYFPIKRKLLLDKVEENSLQREMRRLFELWKESDYTLNREELLNTI